MSLAGTILLCVACAGAVSSAAPPRYRVSDLGESVSIAGMNDAGDVIGAISVGGNSVGWISHAGGPLETLPLPPGMISSLVYDINDAGEIVGAVSNTSSAYDWPFAAVWRPGSNGYEVETLGALPGQTYSTAAAINNLGDIVGSSRGSQYRYPVLFAPSGIVDLTATGIFDPADINDGRTIIAGSKRLSLDSMIVDEIGTPDPHYIATTGGTINEHNDVAGVAIANTQHCESTPARYVEGTGWEILGRCSSWNGAVDMNDGRDTIIVEIPALLVRFEDEGTFAVESLIDPAQGEWVIQYWGGRINNARQIAAVAKEMPSGRVAAVLLTPINACDADFNGDGGVNSLDVLAFLNAWASSDGSADFNDDGDIDTRDVLVYLNAWNAGC
ncbi:MAG: hypothetical protein IPJ41_14815 [Phycisphaerales bacterium]|nr:hypothetical protein [Phycisphaerales bacterium]